MINPLANQIYITQNMHVAANKLGNQLQRGELAQVSNLEQVKEKDKQAQEVRAIESTYKIDPKNEHEKHHQHDQQERSKKLNNQED